MHLEINENHLKEYLPSNPIIKTGGKKAIKDISSAPWGSALACLISYGYIRMLGPEGLKKSTEIAIVNAIALVAPTNNDRNDPIHVGHAMNSPVVAPIPPRPPVFLDIENAF